MTAAPVDASPRPDHRRHRRRILAACAGLALLGGVVEVARWEGSVRSLLDARSQLAAAQHNLRVLTQDPTPQALARVNGELDAAARDLGPDSSRVASAPELNLLGSLPGAGSQVRELRAIRTAGADAVAVARLAMPTAQAVVALGQTGPASQDAALVSGQPAPRPQLLARVTSALADHPTLQPDVAAAVTRLDSDLARVQATHSGGPLSSMRDTVLRDGRQLADESGSAVADAVALRTALVGDHHYLLLLGNPAEERPGGGFIGLAGVITIHDGAITSTSFLDPNSLAGTTTDQPIPRPLKDYLFHEVPWDIADANWSADFPTSATAVSTFWTAAMHQQVDGVIAIDPSLIAALLHVLGPVQTPGYSQVITSSNVLLQLNDIANKIRPGDPGKPFLAAFGQEFLHRLQSAPSAQLGQLLSALRRQLPGRHLLISVKNPMVEHVLAGHDLNGSLAAAPGADQLLVTDANLSGGKNDLFVTRSTDVDVVMSGPTVHHTVTLDYHQPVPVSTEQRKLQPGSGGAYRDYVQLFVPAGAQLTSVLVNGAPSGPEDVTQVAGQEDLAFFQIINPGASETLQIAYDTHPGTTPPSFVLGKQLQSLPHAVSVAVTWRDGRRSQVAHPYADGPVIVRGL